MKKALKYGLFFIGFYIITQFAGHILVAAFRDTSLRQARAELGNNPTEQRKWEAANKVGNRMALIKASPMVLGGLLIPLFVFGSKKTKKNKKENKKITSDNKNGTNSQNDTAILENPIMGFLSGFIPTILILGIVGIIIFTSVFSNKTNNTLTPKETYRATLPSAEVEHPDQGVGGADNDVSGDAENLTPSELAKVEKALFSVAIFDDCIKIISQSPVAKAQIKNSQEIIRTFCDCYSDRIVEKIDFQEIQTMDEKQTDAYLLQFAQPTRKECSEKLKNAVVRDPTTAAAYEQGRLQAQKYIQSVGAKK